MNQPTNNLEKDELEKFAKVVNQISKMLPSVSWIAMRESAKTIARTEDEKTYNQHCYI
jgi:hypothetical protein